MPRRLLCRGPKPPSAPGHLVPEVGLFPESRLLRKALFREILPETSDRRRARSASAPWWSGPAGASQAAQGRP